MRIDQLILEGFEYEELLHPDGLSRLDKHFFDFLSKEAPQLALWLKAYQNDQTPDFMEKDIVHTPLIQCAEYLDQFVTRLFRIEDSVSDLSQKTLRDNPIFYFKKHIVQKLVKRRLKNKIEGDFGSEYLYFKQKLDPQLDQELAMATLAIALQDNPQEKDEFERLLDWCVLAQITGAGQLETGDWLSFQAPKKLDFDALIPLAPESPDGIRQEIAHSQRRQREGFNLTDTRFSRRQVMDEVHYCVYCHKNEGDYCSTGFYNKKQQPEAGFKTNPLGEHLTGCPLDEKISEMHFLKQEGFVIAPLAVVMIDNPLCPATGHRICNDCMKACIYQKQEPVNIPQVETRVLTDVLSLPWGVEVYDLLTKWNPLRQKNAILKPYNGHKVMVMGMGPAGFTLAHYLTLEGFAVVGLDGLKIEPLETRYLKGPIKYFDDLKEPLSERLTRGFGGVAEYGITVRWDKNFLTLIYMTLMRRPTFQVFGGVRFGGTLTVEEAWALGADHLAVAVGAGLPRELPIENAMARGMRQANDFLMALQLTGAAKEKSLVNLQIRLPAIVIGGGLTGVDAATEIQAYYIQQVEKVSRRYQELVKRRGETAVRSRFTTESLILLDEFLSHAEIIVKERFIAHQENRSPDFIKLLQGFGGTTIVYRKAIQDSPAYRKNPEELEKALEEGIYYAGHLTPQRVFLDEFGACQALACIKPDGEECVLAARTILVATGAKPNVAYGFEHKDTFDRERFEYVAYQAIEEILEKVDATPYDKFKPVGMFTSYQDHAHRVTFLGDTHPAFHGNVVKAIASAKHCFESIQALFPKPIHTQTAWGDYLQFQKQIYDRFSAVVLRKKRIHPEVTELLIRAPQAAHRHAPGQFYRLQNFEYSAQEMGGSVLQSEALALLGAASEEHPDSLSFWIMHKGVSSRIATHFEPGLSVSLMGPTGAKTKLPPKNQPICIMGGTLALAYLRVIGPSLKAQGNPIVYLGLYDHPHEIVSVEEARKQADLVIWGFPRPVVQPKILQEMLCFYGDLHEILKAYQAADKVSPPLSTLSQIMVMGDTAMLSAVKALRLGWLNHAVAENAVWTAAVYGPMQCMLKGVCAQCLQWQIDPSTGRRTKAVYACSWQHQPFDQVELENIDQRLEQNSMLECLTEQWYDHILERS